MSTTVSTVIPDDLAANIRERARVERRTVSNLLAMLLENYLQSVAEEVLTRPKAPEFYFHPGVNCPGHPAVTPFCSPLPRNVGT